MQFRKSIYLNFVICLSIAVSCGPVTSVKPEGSIETQSPDSLAKAEDSVAIDILSATTGSKKPALWFAPPWWLKDHETAVLGSIPFSELKRRGFDTYKLWIQHISFLNDPFHKGTFGFGCNPKKLTQSSCPLYFKAAKRLANSGLKIAVETPFQNPGQNPTFKAKYGCSIDNDKAAVEYGEFMATAHFSGVHLKWMESGGRTDLIAIDDSIDKTLKGGLDATCGFVKPDQAVIFTTTYMEAMQKLYKGKIKFVYISNFLNWNYAGVKGFDPRADRKPDLSGFIDSLVKASKNRKLNLVGLQVDAPLSLVVFAKDSVRTSKQISRIQKFAQKTADAGLRFQVIVNTETKHIAPESLPLSNDSYRSLVFQRETIYMADMIRSITGSSLRDVVVQSWHDAPYTLLPGGGSGTHESFFDIARIVSDRYNNFCTVEEYKKRRPDVARDSFFGSRIYYHYQAHGKSEGMCSPRVTANERSCTQYEYLTRRPDVLASGRSPVEHYLKSGAKEGMCNPTLYNKPEISMGRPYNGRIPFLLDL